MEKPEKVGEKACQGLHSLDLLLPQAPGLERELWRTYLWGEAAETPGGAEGGGGGWRGWQIHKACRRHHSQHDPIMKIRLLYR